jgi:rubrerythrin
MEGRQEGMAKDKNLVCKDCGTVFNFTIGEQAYYLAKMLSTPRRCPACRKRRRDTIVPDPGTRGRDD